MEQKRINGCEFKKMVYEKIQRRYSVESVYWITKAVFECMADIVENGDCLYIEEYFSLYPKLKNERRVGNFGNPLIIPKHYVPYFKTHKLLNEVCANLSVALRQDLVQNKMRGSAS